MVLKVSPRWSTLTRLASQELNIEQIQPLPNSPPDQKQNSLSLENSKPLLWGAGHCGHTGVDDRANRGKKMNCKEK